MLNINARLAALNWCSNIARAFAHPISYRLDCVVGTASKESFFCNNFAMLKSNLALQDKLYDGKIWMELINL